ncbi:MAG: heme exporter protein CcmD [Gammaproteobacteria bacterium]|nr:heme exporter protein CcmD [Gammaproteobacteria bacterium]NBY23719.1 heme exporter protein CcmD [Gammaproteobacteria bacterium]NDE34516.1 heme exporter protein CcmD [Gammaproteobacteria bacterium]NDE56112.1 heme exporter protein CcmD [Gammaproteobacteria bacterium]NDG87416.1 heme exporter protein CcmD [Gammaproteobacteria bacterium]
MNWYEFFSMGGYALYVWSSFGLMALLLIANLIWTLQRKSTVTQKLKRRMKSREKSV